eukprot:gene10205-8121_t
MFLEMTGHRVPETIARLLMAKKGDWSKFSNTGAGWSNGGYAGGGVPHPASVSQHLATLGLAPDVSIDAATIKAAFMKCAMAWHPDRHQTVAPTSEEMQNIRSMEDKFKRAQAAYFELKLVAATED